MIMDLNRVPELRKQLEFITSHPEHWQQQYWWADRSQWDSYDDNELEPTPFKNAECGTVGCLAGNAVAHSDEFVIVHRGTGEYTPLRVATNHYITWQVAGAEILGLTDREANLIFSETNSLPTIWALANEFSKGEIEIPENMKDDE